jgi:chemotaxis protein CheZ
MQSKEPRKLFSVERRARDRQAQQVSQTEVPVDLILEELRALRAEVAELRTSGVAVAVTTETESLTENTPPTAPALPTLDMDAEVDIRVEIAQMVRSIGRAKSEIAAIKHPLSAEDQVETAASQLETIVLTTENATNDIMNAADEIEVAMKKIHSLALDDQEIEDQLDIAANQVITIIESCSFQDLTGQRINEVIKTLRFIESRVLSMIEIWGGLEAFQELPIPAGENGDGDDDDESALLNGPAMEGQGLSQDDIDALFC